MNQEKKELKNFLRIWEHDINKISNRTARKEAIFTFLKRFKRNFNPVICHRQKTGSKNQAFFKVGNFVVNVIIDFNKLVKLEVLP